MDQDPSMFFPMNNFGASNSLSPFNIELLMTSIVNNDSLVRSYHEKCAENGQIQQNLDSITETAQQIQQMYTSEKERKEQLQIESADLLEKLNRVQARLEEVENEHVNTDTLNKQTIAELEEKVEQINAKYLDICELFVEQANILNANNLSTLPLARKCTAIKEVLHTNGIQFEWKSPSKQRRKSTVDKVKMKTTRTIAMQTESRIEPSVNITPKPLTCDKGTQYQQSKATRSTCTSAFIHTTDASTNTNSDNDSLNIELALEKMASYPTLLSPIHESTTPKVTTNTCTQTTSKNYRTQGTLTLINNVRKRVNYVRARTKSELLYEVKKEECASPCASPAIFCPSSAQDDPVQVTTQFHHYWQMIGDLLCRMLSAQNMMVDEKHLNNIRIIQKAHEMQNLIAEGMHKKPDDNIGLAGVHCTESIDCEDEHSRDSVESYNSAKIVIAKMRNLSNCSPSSLEENIPSCPPTDNNEDRPDVFMPISPLAERSQIERESQENPVGEEPPLPKQPAITSSIQRRDKTETNPQLNRPLAVNKEIEIGSCSSSKSPMLSVERQAVNEVHFKIPKRKGSTSDSDPIVKKRKSTKVKPQKQQMMTSLFGDLSDDDDNDYDIDEQIRKIFESIHTPKMLSPIKDWCEDVASPSPSPSPSPPVTMDAQECVIPPAESAEHLNAKYETISNETDANATHQKNETLDHTEVLQTNKPPLHTAPNETEPLSLALPDKLVQTTVEERRHEHTQPVECVLEHSLESSQSSEISPNVLIECNADETVEFDDFSPASPKPEDQTSSTDAPKIPINTICHDNEMDVSETSHISTDSALDQIIYNYVSNVRNEVLMCSARFSHAECYLLASLRNAIEKYCIANEWTATAATQCVDRLLSLSRQPEHLATAILEVIEDTKESFSVEFTPPAPVLQPSHQKCVLLVSRLTKPMPKFNQYLQFELERRLFTFAKEAKPIVGMTNLAHFYISLIDIERPSDRAKVRLFIYKCLYYFKTSSVPLIFTVIMAHPYVLPHAQAIESSSDPLIRAIASALSNIVYMETSAKGKNLKKNEMFHTLKRRYGFFADKMFSIDVVIDFCIECIRLNRLQHVDYALILLAKRKDFEYAAEKIIEKHLSPMLQQYFSMNLNATTEHDGKICTILFTIGSIVKTFPIEENVCGYIDMFVTCLNATQRQSIQEAAILAICQLSRFGTTQIYQHLANWKPNYKISAHIKAILRTIVYRKSKQYWFGDNKNYE
ncbi:little elongation complex subunit 1 [Sitodiplosis mosellana]|uniref:little elongation complex subunit 1 n=1 Tax=Sitodiplosis mosellana TaxID=263140 RepID=UPI002443EEFC|nr:little elongation complex subunit 1 [Sitodiplosis mosellana]